MPADRELSRRDLFTFWRRKEPPPPAAPLRSSPPLRPPGAVDEDHFLSACERCGLCMAACPRCAIGPLPPGPGAGTPFIVARQAPCVVCDGLQCTQACPTGALTPLQDPRTIRMGTAVVTPAHCLAYRGETCHACVDSCPIPGAIAAVAEGNLRVPRVEAAVCIGCGLCENYCPPEPAAIRIIPAR